MSMTKTIEIDGQPVAFRASAAVPRLYRMQFHRDIYRDLAALDRAAKKDSDLDTFSLELFENIAYVMARHADPDIPDTPEEWLDSFSTFSIYQILPEIIELWGLNMESQVKTKKNRTRQSGK